MFVEVWGDLFPFRSIAHMRFSRTYPQELAQDRSGGASYADLR